MKKTWLLRVALTFTVAGLLMSGCSTGSGSSDDPTGTTTDSTPAAATPATPAAVTPATQGTPVTPTNGQKDDTATPTLIDITGTWENVYHYSGSSIDETDTTALTINSDGTFFRYVTEEYGTTAARKNAGNNCYAEKGTVSVSADGKATFSITMTYDNPNAIDRDLSNLPWISESYTSYGYAAKKGGKLFLGVFKRQGSGTGIKGTWVSENNDAGEIEKHEFIIGDTPSANAAVMKYYLPFYSGSWELIDNDTYDSYEIADGKISLYQGTTRSEKYDLTYTNEFLALGSGYERI